MKTIQDADALLTYKVGPVYCCSPTLSVESVMMPPKLNHPPGSEPGVFKHVSGMVKVVDLRSRFGLPADRWQQPGKIIVVEVESGRTGFWVDEILDVIDFPKQGWKPLNALMPTAVFSRALLLKNNIHLYADFEKLAGFSGTGYLREHIEQLIAAEEQQHKVDNISPSNKSIKTTDKTSAAPQTHSIKQADEISPIQKNKADTTTQSPIKKQNNKASLTTKNGLQNSRHVAPVPRPHKQVEKKSQEKTHSVKPATVIKPPPLPPNKTSIKDASATSNENKEKYQPPKNNYQPMHEDKQSSSSWGFVIWLVVLVIIAVGIYLFLFTTEKNKSLHRSPPLQLQTIENKNNEVAHVNKAYEIAAFNEVIISQPNNLNEESHDINAESSANEIKYQATIEKDDEGVTIILSSEEVKSPAPNVDTNTLTAYDTKNQNTNSTINKNEQQDAEIIDMPSQLVEEEKPLAVSVEKSLTSKKITREEVIIVHIVVKGDTLWDIAKRYVKDPFKYAELARLSKIENPDLIYPGDRVTIIRILSQ